MSISTGTVLKIVATIAWSDGNLMQNVFNAVVTGGAGPWDAADIVLDAIDWLDTMYANLTSSTSDECAGSQVQVYEYDSGDADWDEVGSAAWTWTPSSTADELPRGVAGLINAKSLNPDVSAKKYVGGLTEGVTVDGLIQAGTLAALADFASDWTTGFVGSDSLADWEPVVWSYVGTQPWVFTGAVIIPAIPAYQRRRKQGVGI